MKSADHRRTNLILLIAICLCLKLSYGDDLIAFEQQLTQSTVIQPVKFNEDWSNIQDFAIYGWVNLNQTFWNYATLFRMTDNSNFTSENTIGDRVLCLKVLQGLNGKQLNFSTYDQTSFNPIVETSINLSTAEVANPLFVYLGYSSSQQKLFAFVQVQNGNQYSQSILNITHTFNSNYNILLNPGQNLISQIYFLKIATGSNAYRESNFNQLMMSEDITGILNGTVTSPSNQQNSINNPSGNVQAQVNQQQQQQNNVQTTQQQTNSQANINTVSNQNNSQSSTVNLVSNAPNPTPQVSVNTAVLNNNTGQTVQAQATVTASVQSTSSSSTSNLRISTPVNLSQPTVVTTQTIPQVVVSSSPGLRGQTITNSPIVIDPSATIDPSPVIIDSPPVVVSNTPILGQTNIINSSPIINESYATLGTHGVPITIAVNPDNYDVNLPLYGTGNVNYLGASADEQYEHSELVDQFINQFRNQQSKYSCDNDGQYCSTYLENRQKDLCADYIYQDLYSTIFKTIIYQRSDWQYEQNFAVSGWFRVGQLPIQRQTIFRFSGVDTQNNLFYRRVLGMEIRLSLIYFFTYSYDSTEIYNIIPLDAYLSSSPQWIFFYQGYSRLQQKMFGYLSLPYYQEDFNLEMLNVQHQHADIYSLDIGHDDHDKILQGEVSKVYLEYGDYSYRESDYQTSQPYSPYN